MAYEVRYTDNVNKGTIVVEDSTLNSETSLVLPGRSSTGYGQAVAENFLHLLENFANATAPERPVEGQLWYDNTEGVDQLKVYDGTTWSAAGGLKRATSQPAVANSVAGDLWVNTDSQQLYLFTGSAWVLVGPSFSDGLLTGAQSEAIVGSDDLTYNVLIIKVEDKPAAIIAKQAFIPKTTIPGFRSGIKAGYNLSTEPLFGLEVLKYYGISEKAEALVVSGETIPAANFLRGDGQSTTNFQLRVKSNDGVEIGTGGQLKLQIDGTAGVIENTTSGSNIDFNLKSGLSTNTVMRIDSTKKVGINNIAPDEELDVIGNVQIAPLPSDENTGKLLVESTTNATDVGEGAVIIKGGASIAQNLYVSGNLVMKQGENSAGSITTGNIAPDNASVRNIGTAANKYDQVYANTFYGNIQGNVNGTVSGRAGSADRLSSATTFSIGGDVTPNSFAFDGQTGGSTKTFDVRIANSFISNKSLAYDVENADEILINKTVGTTGLYRVSKRNFLKTIPLTPPGVIVPYGGLTAPEGWLLCDGTEKKKSDYNELWLAIGHNFKDPALVSDNGVSYFTLPDLRGRFALGADNMGGPSANRVTDLGADAVGNSGGNEDTTVGIENLPEHEHDMEGPSGTQYYGMRVATGDPLDVEAINLPIEPGAGGTQGFATSGGVLTSTALGQPVDVMNPYLTINYIIYTGQ
jgi:microcystin-dependent protein